MKTREQCTHSGGTCSNTTFCLQENDVHCVQQGEPSTLRNRNKRRKNCSKLKETTSFKMKLRSHSFVTDNNVNKGKLTGSMQVENEDDRCNITKARTKEALCGEKTFDFKLESSGVMVSSGSETPVVAINGPETITEDVILANKSTARRKSRQATLFKDEEVNQGNLRRSKRLKRPSSKVFEEKPAKRIRGCMLSINTRKEKELEETPAMSIRECMPLMITRKEKVIKSQSSAGSKKETETTHVKGKPNKSITARKQIHRKDVKSIITSNWKALVAYMDPDSVLESMKVRSMFWPSKLSDMTNAKSQKNRDLLQFIIQRDSSAYINLKDCLQETNQDLILALLEEAEVDGNVREVTEEIEQEMKEWNSPFNKLFRALKATISKLDWKKKKLICYAYVYIGREVLMAVFVKRVEDLRPSDIDPSAWTVDLFLENRKYQIEAIQPTLSRAIMNIIFPSADLRLWDVSLFCQLLINICDVSGPLKKCLEWMHQQKNKISKCNNENFEQKFKTMEEYIFFFADKAQDVDLTRRIADQLRQVETGVIPNSNTAIITSAIHRSSDNLKEQIKSKHMNTMAEMTRCKEELRKTVEKGNSVLLKKMDTIIQNQRQIIQMQEPGCSSAVPVTKVKIIVQNVSPETEIVISEMIVKSFRFEGPPNDNVIQEAVEEVRKAYRKKDYTIVQARLGCVELFIQCPSIVSLLAFLRDYLSGDLDALLEPLQTSARILYGINELQFETVIYEDQFNSILSLLDINCQQDYSKKTTYKESNTAFNNKERDESCRANDCLAQADINCKEAYDKETIYEATRTVINNNETKESSQNRDNLTNEDKNCSGCDEETTYEATSIVVNNKVTEESRRSNDSLSDTNVNYRPSYDQEELVKETSIASNNLEIDESAGSSGISPRYGQSKNLVETASSLNMKEHEEVMHMDRPAYFITDDLDEGTLNEKCTFGSQVKKNGVGSLKKNGPDKRTFDTHTRLFLNNTTAISEGNDCDKPATTASGETIAIQDRTVDFEICTTPVVEEFTELSRRAREILTDTEDPPEDQREVRLSPLDVDMIIYSTFRRERLEQMEYRLGHSPESTRFSSGSQTAKLPRLERCYESCFPVKDERVLSGNNNFGSQLNKNGPDDHDDKQSVNTRTQCLVMWFNNQDSSNASKSAIIEMVRRRLEALRTNRSEMYLLETFIPPLRAPMTKEEIHLPGGLTYLEDHDVPGTNSASDYNRRGNYNYFALYAELLSYFEIKRRGLFPNKNKRTQINLPISLTEKYTLDNNVVSVINLLKHYDQFIRDNKLTFSSELVKSLFKGLVKKITILDHIIILDITTIVAGGYSDSQRLQSVVKANLPRIKVVILQEEVTSIMKCALTFTHMPRQIPNRVLKFTYGIKTNLQFREGIDPESKRMQCDRGDTCKQRFTKHVERGQSVNVGEPQTEIAYSPLNKSQNRLCLHIYASELENPQYTDDNCMFVGKLIVDLSNHCDLNRSVNVSLTFSDNEIVVTARDKKTGKKSALAFAFLG